MAEQWEELDAEQLAGARRLRWFLAVMAAAVVILAVIGAV